MSAVDPYGEHRQDEKDPMVDHPPHYTQGGIECIDAIEAALGPQGFIDYCRGTAIKYMWRARHKGNLQQDSEKAEWYSARAAATAKKLGKSPAGLLERFVKCAPCGLVEPIESQDGPCRRCGAVNWKGMRAGTPGEA